MVVTCYLCPTRIAFAGSDRSLYARLFGWLETRGRYYCTKCREGE